MLLDLKCVADCMGCRFRFPIVHNKDSISKEGNEKSLHKNPPLLLVSAKLRIKCANKLRSCQSGKMFKRHILSKCMQKDTKRR